MGETDLISRQAAIDCMMRLQREDEEAYGASIPEGFDGDRAAEALMQLPSAHPEIRYYGQFEIKDPILISEQRWIPCSERLPEEYGEYLITWETAKAPTRFIGFAEGEETGVWDDQHDRFVFSWLPEDYIIERYPDWRVVAWMPLPEPYKEGE